MLVFDKTINILTACDFDSIKKNFPVEIEGLQYWRFLEMEPETDETS